MLQYQHHKKASNLLLQKAREKHEKIGRASGMNSKDNGGRWRKSADNTKSEEKNSRESGHTKGMVSEVEKR